MGAGAQADLVLIDPKALARYDTDASRRMVYREIFEHDQLVNRSDGVVTAVFIAGEQDVLVPAPVVEAMHRKVPHSKFIQIAGAGHSAYFETPDEFNRVVMDFLAEHVRN